MKINKIEDYLLIISEIILIILFSLLFHFEQYVYSFVCFIGAILIWLFENGNIHLIVFWTLLITGVLFVLIFGNFLLGIILVLFAFGELFLNDALRGNH